MQLNKKPLLLSCKPYSILNVYFMVMINIVIVILEARLNYNIFICYIVIFTDIILY